MGADPISIAFPFHIRDGKAKSSPSQTPLQPHATVLAHEGESAGALGKRDFLLKGTDIIDNMPSSFLAHVMPDASAAFRDLEEKVKRITEASASETTELLYQW
ncbi:hypothetical protein MUG91_G120n103 [Manis pentadactyla]|nr:hypothetical protein MUG91_G120n103 [Manis pentadactyla]